MVRRVLTSAVLSVWLVATGTAWPQSRPPASEEVEAAYLYQFGRYVEWPSDPAPGAREFVICVLGADPYGGALDKVVQDKAVGERRVVVRRILGPGESNGCRILFISPSEESRVAAILDALEGTGIVTVGRGAQFTRRGGMIAFTAEERRVRFVVNLAAADAGGVRFSSQLLRVAARVEQ